jgi:hypothetical protein
MSVVPEVARQIDRRHAAAPERPLDDVAVGQGSLKASGGGVGQLEPS